MTNLYKLTIYKAGLSDKCVTHLKIVWGFLLHMSRVRGKEIGFLCQCIIKIDDFNIRRLLVEAK